MSFAVLVKTRLKTLGYDQKDLAHAARVTESYVSQLLSRRKPPPGRSRTDIYGKMEMFLGLKEGELGRLAEAERAEEVKRRFGQAPGALFQEFRDLVLRKCAPGMRDEVRAIFEQQPFGTLEQLVARKLLETVQEIARNELDSENWIRLAARVGGRGDREMRVLVLEFLDTDIFDISSEGCVAFLDPLVESWSVNLETLRLDIMINRKLVVDARRTFAFVENGRSQTMKEEPALAEFRADRDLSHDATEEEIQLLRMHSFGDKRPTRLYYYRALQNLRDPLHFGKR